MPLLTLLIRYRHIAIYGVFAVLCAFCYLKGRIDCKNSYAERTAQIVAKEKDKARGQILELEKDYEGRFKRLSNTADNAVDCVIAFDVINSLPSPTSGND